MDKFRKPDKGQSTKDMGMPGGMPGAFGGMGGMGGIQGGGWIDRDMAGHGPGASTERVSSVSEVECSTDALAAY
jgi:hypothetical protein